MNSPRESLTRTLSFACAVLLVFVVPNRSTSHETTRQAFAQARQVAQADTAANAEDVNDLPKDRCELRIEVVVAGNDQSVPAVVRIVNPKSGKTIPLKGEIHRNLNWYSLDASATVSVPPMKLRIEAIRGLDTELAATEIDLTGQAEASVKLSLKNFYDTHFRGLRGGNTHLHLMKLTHEEALRYLSVVPRSDAIELVYLSYLRRVPDERHYISNQIVADSFTGGSLHRLSQHGILFDNGEEHRHNFGRGDQGYGHVMLLNLEQLIKPVSLGPGIMGEGTDDTPLQNGIRAAHEDQATVIWCHNTFGFEDIPNWMAGLIDAQNIYDGGTHGTYEDTFYRYLNLGLKVPFSTGTDWFMYDFSRVYVPLHEDLTSASWLKELRDGRSFITNGPLLELEAERGGLGDTLTLPAANRVSFMGKAMGRVDFGQLEMIYNGKVVDHVVAKKEAGYYHANKTFRVEIEEPGWVALRIKPDANVNELGRPLFAHTSPIYIEVGGKSIFREEIAEQLVAEMKQSVQTINVLGKFTSDATRARLLTVYETEIRKLEERIEREKQQ
ncbi:MAG: CehA/McbA family metallohydrolase [Planctomycetota bacterium]|nr:CehA/McbA family metallohydrolase [Planctomycetota bacterium]